MSKASALHFLLRFIEIMDEFTEVFTGVVGEVEKKVKEAALNAVKETVIDKHIEQVFQIRQSFSLGDTEILSSNIAINHDIPTEIQQQIGSFQAKLRAVIERAALEIENYKYRSSEEAISKMRLSYNERTQVNELLSADKKINISFQSLKVATELFSSLNDQIVQQIEEYEKSEDTLLERELLLANAILVYELSDFLVSYLESFKLQGAEEISKTQRYMNEKLTQLEQEQDDLKQRAESDEIRDPQVKQQIVSNTESRKKAIQRVRDEWKNYADVIEELRTNLSATTKEIPTLKLIRDDAKSQIDVLTVATVMNAIKSSVNAFESAILTLKKVKLISLNDDRVIKLLNISQDAKNKRLDS
jgi:hypothetical protein